MRFGLKQDNKRAKENSGGFGLIKKGEYELIVTDGQFRNEQGKTPNINLALAIRTDFDQEFKGRKLFHTMWISQVFEPKEGKEKSPYEYCMEMIEAFTMACGAPDGVEFSSPEEVIKFVKGKGVRGYVGVREHDGKEYNEIKSFKVSEKPGIVQQDTTNGGANMQKTEQKSSQQKFNDDPFANDGQPIDIDDDDLPF